MSKDPKQEPLPPASEEHWGGRAFPSDFLTIGQMRQMTRNWDDMDACFYNMHAFEADIIGYAKSYRDAAPDSTDEKLTLHLLNYAANDLVDVYVRLGVAAGPHEAKVVVDRFIGGLMAKDRKAPECGGRE